MACNALRTAIADANKCGCKLPGDNRLQCRGLTEVPPSCVLWELAQRQDNLFQVNAQSRVRGLNPFASKIDRLAHQKAVTNLKVDVEKLKGEAKKAFPELSDADLDDLQYWKMQRCLINADGDPAVTPNGSRKFVGRTRLQTTGYSATPLINVPVPKAAKLPESVARLVPVAADRVAPPEIILLIILLVLVAVALGLYSTHKHAERKRRREAYMQGLRAHDASIAAREANDPWAKLGSPTYQVDPNDHLRELVPQYEARGYCMAAYRKKLGMPARPDAPGC